MKDSATAAPAVAESTSLAAEIRQVWQQWPDKPLFFALLAVWLALFHFLGNSTFGYVDTGSLILWLNEAYTASNSDDGHGPLIPLVVLVLFWFKKEKLIALEKAVWWPAIGLVVAGLGIHVIGYMIQQPRISVIAMLIGLYGMLGLVWGKNFMRQSFFPFCLLIFCVPVGSLAEAITFPLRILVAKISVGFTHGLFGVDVVRDGSRIFDSQFKFNYDVAPACSGIRSLISLLAVTTIYGFVNFQTQWKRWVMLLAAVPLAVLGNVVRLIVVIFVAAAFGQERGAAIEQKLGFVTFFVAIVCTLVIARLMREKDPLPATTPAEVTP
jgi:exosortase